MKRTAAILFILAAIAAQARPVWVYPPTETVRWWSPPETVVDANEQRWQDPTPAKMEACGWVICEIGAAAVDDCVVDFAAVPPVRPMSAQELADRQAAKEAAEAQAAAYSFPAPEVVVPVLDANGERTGTARLLVDSTGQIVVVTDTASPQRTAAVQIAEFKAKSESRRQKMSAGKAAAASANSVPALRAAVAQIIEALEE